MSKIKVIDISKVIKSFLIDSDFKLYNDCSELNAIIIGKEKIILSDNEACHTMHVRSGIIKLNLGFQSQRLYVDSGVNIETEASMTVPVEAFIKTAEEQGQEEELGKFVRTFGSRIENNYRILLNTIKEIGLNPKDYPRVSGNRTL